MDYKDVRRKFIELSGRYDLVNPDWTDNGADFYLNAGQKWLDRLQDTGKMNAKNVQSIAAGTTKVYIDGLRAVKSVWIGVSTDGLVRLAKASLDYLRQLYEKQLGSVDQGTPKWYAPAVFRPYSDVQTTTTLSGYYDIDDLILPTGAAPVHYTYSGIVIVPPPDQTYYLSIYGLYYSPALSATLAAGTWTQTKSVWTENYPDMLIKAALMQLEIFYRNAEGSKEWKAAVLDDVVGMDKDQAEEEAADISEMGG